MPGEDEEEPCLAYTYADKELGLRLGTQSNLGFFGLDCVDGFKYDHLRIEAVNYNRKNNDNTYEKEINGSIIDIDGYQLSLKTNGLSDKPDTIVKKTFTFNELQSDLYILAAKGRPCILKMELWSE